MQPGTSLHPTGFGQNLPVTAVVESESLALHSHRFTIHSAAQKTHRCQRPDVLRGPDGFQATALFPSVDPGFVCGLSDPPSDRRAITQHIYTYITTVYQY